MNMTNDSRRYDIDWLRVLAFILLIFYHIGMFYVADWGWHVKSAYQSEFLQNFMLMVNQWRMPLIFLISGMALALVEPKISRLKLIKMRFVRVFIPLVVGMYLIVPPQLFYQIIQNDGFAGSYLDFLSFYLDPTTDQFPQYQYSPLGLLTWNHLWYLAYLWHYTLVYLLLKPLLIRLSDFPIFQQCRAWSIFLVPALILTAFGLALRHQFPTTHALVDDWYNHAIYFSVFLGGYVIAKAPAVWSRIIHQRKTWLILAIANFVLLLLFVHDFIGSGLRALGADTDHLDSLISIQFLIEFFGVTNMISWLYCMLGFAGKYLNRQSSLLSYLNEAVLPWYILHQTVTIIVAMNLAQHQLGPVTEPLLVIILTFAVCAGCYELLKRTHFTRFLFGLKLLSSTPKQTPAGLINAKP